MNQALSKQEFTIQEKEKTLYQNNFELLERNSLRELLNKKVADISKEILDLQKLDLEPEIFIQKLIQVVKKLLKINGYFVSSKIDNESLFELQENFDTKLKSYLFDGGLIQLSLTEKRSLLIEYSEKFVENNSENLLIIPFILSEGTLIVFCLLLAEEKSEIFSSIFPLIEIQFSLAGSYFINKILQNKNEELKSNYLELEGNLNQELSYSTSGRICLKSFHSLKNKTQIIVSSFNLLRKLIDGKEDERLEKIFSILEKEIPEFARNIKLISDFSKALVTESKPVYFEFDRLINNLQDIFYASGISDNFKFNFLTKISRSKIFGYNQKLLQAFSLLLLEIYSAGIKEVNFSNDEDENRLKFRLNVNLIEEDGNKLINLLDGKSNSKFVQIINVFKQNSCNVITKSGDGYFEILISIPKRSSQFKPENLNYVKNFDSRG
jgi:hypothetical protein